MQHTFLFWLYSSIHTYAIDGETRTKKEGKEAYQSNTNVRYFTFDEPIFIHNPVSSCTLGHLASMKHQDSLHPNSVRFIHHLPVLSRSQLGLIG